MNLAPYLSRCWSPEYDCWSLVRDFYLREYGIDLPVVSIDSQSMRDCLREMKGSPIRDEFVQVETADNGCVVEMGAQDRPFHVGIWIDGRILHNFHAGGVVCEPAPPFEILGIYASRTLLSQSA